MQELKQKLEELANLINCATLLKNSSERFNTEAVKQTCEITLQTALSVMEDMSKIIKEEISINEPARLSLFAEIDDESGKEESNNLPQADENSLSPQMDSQPDFVNTDQQISMNMAIVEEQTAEVAEKITEDASGDIQTEEAVCEDKPKEEASVSVNVENVVVEINQQPDITELKQALSIADRFRFQRELFGGNGEKMSEAISVLNDMPSLEEALNHVANNLKLDINNPITTDFIAILKRKKYI